MNALLLALLLSAAPEAPLSPSPETNPEPLAAEAPQHAVWIQPLGVVGGQLFNNTLYVPVGFNLPMKPAMSLGVEVSLVMGSMRAPYDTRESVPGFYRLMASVGPMLSLSGKALSGPFIQPKLTTNLSYEQEYGYDEYHQKGGASAELRFGMDLGWQFVTEGGWYIAPVLGASVGYCFNCATDGTAPFEFSRVGPPVLNGYGSKRANMPVVGLNVHLLRVGTVF